MSYIIKVINRTMIKYNGIYWQIWGIRLFSRGSSRLLKIVEDNLASNKRKYWIATVNPEFVIKATDDKNFLKVLNQTNINVVDGIGLIWAREVREENNIINRISLGWKTGVEILRGNHRDKMASGADLIDGMCKIAESLGKTVYFLGGWGNRAKKTADFFKKKYPKLKVAGAETGGNGEPPSFKLRQAKPDFLFVAFGMKKQEEWIYKYLNKIDAGVVMGVGRSFDYYSGELKRAPIWVRNMGMEWFYSLIKEPKRWKRQLALPKFVWRVIFS